MDKITINTILTFTCDKCGKSYTISGKIYKQRQKRGNPNYCKECMKRYSVENANATKANMSEERKAEYSKKVSEGNIKYWENISKEERDRRIDLLKLQNSKQIWNDDTRKNHGLKVKQGQNNMSADDIKNMRMKQSESMIKHYLNMTPEERIRFSNLIKNSMSKMSNKEKNNMKQGWIKKWDSLSNDDHYNHTHNAIVSSAGNNDLHKKFEKYFKESTLHRYYKISREVLLNDEVSHSWDYGVFDFNDNLIAVIDLDGAYYHADSCDYDCIHSKEEYDEKRVLSLSGNIKSFIITEKDFVKSFGYMVANITLDYEEYLDSIFKLCRSIPFPFPSYKDEFLLKSFNSLVNMKVDGDVSLNTHIGDRIIYHFHQSIYSAHTKGNVSPHEAWYNDNLLRKCIENRIIYQNNINPNKILQGFNVSKIAPKVSVFSAGRAKLLISKYLNEFDIIYDPFSGFSGRMVGTLSLNKSYIGQDISEIHVRESNQMINFLKEYGVNINASIIKQDILQSYGEYPCLFTCPPYSDKEIWENVPIDIRTCDEWIDVCLSHFKCKRYLFVVDDTLRYKDYIADIITNKSHLNKNNEYVIIIDRGD